MSLINQMLTDLEKRRSREQLAAGELLREVRASGRSGPGLYRRLSALTVLIGSALAVAVTVGGWLLTNPRPAVPHQAGAETVRIAVPVAGDHGPATPAAPPAEPAAPIVDDPVPVVAGAPREIDIPDPRPRGAVAGEEEIAAASSPGALREPDQLQETSVSRRQITSVAPAAVEAMEAEKGVKAVEAVFAPANSEPSVAGAMARVMRTPTAEEKAAEAIKEARAALAAGRPRQAEAQLRQALAVAPEHRAGREALTTLLATERRSGEAEMLLQDGLRLAPSHLPYVKAYARLLAERGEWLRAGELLRQGEAPPLAADPEFHALAAAVHQRLGQFAAAADLYRQLLALTPGNGTWWVGLGIALEGEGQGREADQAYRRGLAVGGISPELAQYARERVTAITR